MNTVSDKIAQWVQATNYSAIPLEVVNLAKRCILDFIGVTFAGTSEPAAQIVKQFVNDSKGKEQATVIGLKTKTSCIEAAFANGLIGHCLDYDDVIHPIPGAGGPHMTSAIFPATLAIAEKEKKNGKEIIEAYVMGFEVAYRMGRAIEPFHYTSGWHNTGTEGIFGATIAASKLLSLNSDQMAYALGIAASEASGLGVNFGTMTKPFHAGEANAKGVRAAMLAKLGFNSAKNAFEGKKGFFSTMCKDVKAEELTENIGKPFALTEVKFKPYPCCGGMQSGIGATLELVTEYNIKPEEVEQITVRCVPLAAYVLVYHNPKTPLEGKFSMQFGVALAIHDRKVTLQQFNDEKINDPVIVALINKTKLIVTPELAIDTAPAEPVIVEIKLKSGKTVTKRYDFHQGTPQNPLSDNELFQKYRSCSETVLSEKKIEETIDVIMNLEKMNTISKLVNILRG